MHDSHAVDRRLLIAVTLLLASLLAVALMAFARPAAADCPVEGCGGGGGGVTETITNTLTVNRPSAGTILSVPAGISCPAGSGGTCSVSQSQTVACDELPCDAPTTGWNSYTLSASGGFSGFAPNWSGGGCSGSSCSVTLDVDRTVSMSWIDVTNPTVSIAVAKSDGEVGPLMFVGATASDNAGVASVKFLVDGVLKATDTTAPYSANIDMGGYAHGSSHTVTARATDTSNRVTDQFTTVTVDKQVSLTAGTVDPYTSATFVPVSFSTDPDATVHCLVTGGSVTPCSGSFSPSLPTEGTYTYTFTATDNVGNTATATRTFVVDRTAPHASFTDGPSEGAVVGSGLLAFTFDYSDATPVIATCALDSVGFTACDDPHSETLSGLAPGSSHTFRVQVEDAAGNVTQLVRHFSVIAPPPVVTSGGASQGTPAGQPRLAKAKLSSSFKLKGKNTVVKKLMLTGLPDDATVRLRCKGHGCPFRSKSFKAKHGRVVLTNAFRHRLLRRGAKIEIDVLPTGSPTQVFRLSMRAGKKPLQKTA